MTKPPETPVHQLLDTVWKYSEAETAQSYPRLNRSMAAAIELAIDCGMSFTVDDLNMPEFRHHRWWPGDERLYALAVTTGNLSAARAIEKHKRRPPFIADNVTSPDSRIRRRGRLAVGFHFPWQGHKVEVTSFAGDGTHLIACEYKQQSYGGPATRTQREELRSAIQGVFSEWRDRHGLQANYGRSTGGIVYDLLERAIPHESRKPIRRFRITRADIKADRAARKAWEKANPS